MKIDVVNKHHGHKPDVNCIYIGRGSPLGNPFSHMDGTKAEHRVESRQAAVDAYRSWLDSQIESGSPAVLAELMMLYGIARNEPLKLLCFCAPQACHGDVIREVLMRADANQEKPLDTSKMIFVFGSNLAGKHGKGAALTARKHHGAIQGLGEGLMNRCYALPTQWTPWKLMPIDTIGVHVSIFKSCAASHPELEFQVTQVGCGLAGHRKETIAPMFHDAPPNCLFDTAWQPILGDRHRYWGTF